LADLTQIKIERFSKNPSFSLSGAFLANLTQLKIEKFSKNPSFSLCEFKSNKN